MLTLEAREAHALVELAVVDRDPVARPRAARARAARGKSTSTQVGLHESVYTRPLVESRRQRAAPAYSAVVGLHCTQVAKEESEHDAPVGGGAGTGGRGGRAARLGAGAVAQIEDEAVVDAELAFGHAAQEALHEHAAGDVRAEHLALRRHEQVHVLEHVQEELVATVLDALAPPPDLTYWSHIY